MSPLDNQLASADLQKRSKELDLREETILERERILDTSSKLAEIKTLNAQITILQSKIKVKEEQLDGLAKTLFGEIEGFEKLVTTHKYQLGVLQTAIDAKQAELAQIAARVVTSNKINDGAKGKLAEINMEIKEAKQYLREQEKLVSDTISDLQVELANQVRAAEGDQQIKRELSTDIVRLGQEKSSLVEENDLWTDKLKALEETYQIKLSERRDALDDLDQAIANKELHVAALERDMAIREQSLVTREKSLSLKEAANTRLENELGQKDRRLQQLYGTAGIDYT